MKMIPLTKGKFAKVDDQDYEWLSEYNWYYNDGYAARTSPVSIDWRRRPIYMHREIIGASPEKKVDHIDGDTLNNTRKNLRSCTVRQNGQNRKLSKNNTSGYKGVHFVKHIEKWQATIKVRSKRTYLGVFETPEEAARAYDKAAKKEYGEFARTNFG